ncbi:MAG: FAD:protein FMN transferase [Fuerstiella sp.]|nr:FAD:protein FMN transferase [Fuerstiella sp.]
MAGSEKSRRDLLLGSVVGQRDLPVAGPTLRLSIHSMACDFGAAVSAGETAELLSCGHGLEIVPEIESWLSSYQSESELSQLNTLSVGCKLSISDGLFRVLQLSKELSERTDGAFDMASGAQNRLWKQCRAEQRIPAENEIQYAVAASGMQHIQLEEDSRTVTVKKGSLSLDPGAIGKGFALDRAVEIIELGDIPPKSFLIHGGRSSLMARGKHNGLTGWPVGLGNPLLTNRRLGTVILRNQAMSTSGSNIQFFRCEGRRFGHILDPRTGWPVEGMLSVTVLAESAAVADALSTAFFVLGVEKAVQCCDNFPEIGVILVPFPDSGARVHPVVVGISPDQLYWDEGLVALS